MYIHRHVYMCTYVCIYTHPPVHQYMYKHVHIAGMYLYIDTITKFMWVYTPKCICTQDTYRHACTYLSTYIHGYVDAYIHTYEFARVNIHMPVYYIDSYRCVYKYIPFYVCIYPYVQTSIYTHVACECIHVYAHTHPVEMLIHCDFWVAGQGHRQLPKPLLGSTG